MQQFEKIPIVVGVTGHRNICDESISSLKQQVREALTEIQSLCCNNDAPVVMLCGMAQGADMLCAEVAFEMNIPVYALLPFDVDRFYASFDNTTDRDKLNGYLDRCAKIIYSPDVEQQKEFMQSKDKKLSDDSYWYRQVGIYTAMHSHLVIALWDGKGSAEDVKYGCGTVEVVEFALEHNYLNKDHLFKSGMINDSAVIWIKTDRNKADGGFVSDSTKKEWLVSKCGEDEQNDKQEKYYNRFNSLTTAPDFLTETINETAAYNKAECKRDDYCHLWDNVDELDDYHKNIRSHFIKADKLSYETNQPKYKNFMLAFAILGALIALAFLIYDDASLPWMMIPCTVAVGIVIALSVVCKKRSYHNNYIKYRAFAEALRIQFYLTLCLNETEGLTNVCDLYSWSQKVKYMWIRKAIRAIDVVSDNKPMQHSQVFLDKVKEAWVGKGRSPEGQLSYHSRKKGANKKLRDKYAKATEILTWATITLYALICVFEIVAFVMGLSDKAFFWSGESAIGLSYRSIGAIVVGTLAAASLLFSGYWGKRSFDRLYDDNDKMSKLYQSAYSRWAEVATNSDRSDKEFENFVKEIARDEIVENGIWCSYIEENTLDMNL